MSTPDSAPAPRMTSELAFPLLLGAMVLILLARPIHDVDVFWQVKLGELALHHGGPIAEEPFSATHAGEPLVPIAWLGQIVFAAVHRIGDWPGLQAFDAILWASGFLAAAAAARRAGSTTGAATIAVGLAFVASLPFASLRPQTFAVLSFGLLLALLRSSRPTVQKLALAAPLLVVWQNLHPSVTVAAAAAAGAAAFGWGRWLMDRARSRPWADTWVVGLAAAASLATPAGWHLFAASAYNAAISRELGVSEWLPMWSPSNRSDAFPAWAAVAVSILLLARRPRRVWAEDVGRGAVLGAMMLTAYRFSPFWALSMIPVWAGTLSPAEAPPANGPRNRLAVILAAVVSVGLAVMLAPIVRPRLFAEDLPLAGIDRLRHERVAGVIYCHPPWGGPLIGRGYPDWRVTFDGRYYLYSRDEWDLYFRAARGELPLAELDRLYRPAAFVLRADVEAALIEELRASGEWQELSSDGHSVVWVRRPQNEKPKPQ
jgi:hypothetical protein